MVEVEGKKLYLIDLHRSKYRCKMPGCLYEGFRKENGERYIEAHNKIPLSVDGDDSISNTAALCPICHKVMHYDKDREQLVGKLRRAVRNANE
jgi:predicted HNH restriction endonuclease